MKQFDVVVIGSGAGGGAIAWALSRHKIRTLVLEAGPSFTAGDYPLHRPNWEQSRFPQGHIVHPSRYQYAKMQPLESRWDNIRSWSKVNGLLNKTDRRRAWKYHHVRGVGGSTLHFTGESHRLHPEAMKMRSRFGEAADWPFNYEELEPYYCEAEKIVGVAGPDHNTSRPRSKPYPLPAHIPGYASQKLMEGGAKLGLNWEANPRAALSKPYDDRPACNYCANCNRGCPREDKGSVDVTFIRKAAASGYCTIKSDAMVQRILPGKNDRVDSVEYIDAEGQRHRVKTRVLVLACGAIETPRLLLLSSSSAAPDGLANESGQVGRNFMETISWVTSGLHPENLGSYRGLPSDVICWDYNRPDAIPGVTGGCRFSSTTAEVDLVGPINYATRVVKGWGSAHKQAMRQTFGRALSVGAIGESLPNDRTYIDLEPEKLDHQGRPVARIHSYLDDNALAMLSFMADKCREQLKASGVTELVEEYGQYDFFNSTHVFGTCRMGKEPENSVVDQDGRSHRWKNLYIADASIFPSSGGGESPSLTIEALAIRTADKIRIALLQRNV